MYVRFGFELETKGISRTALAELLHSIVGGTIYDPADLAKPVRLIDERDRTWIVESKFIRPYRLDRSAELRSPHLTLRDLERVRRIVAQLKAVGARIDESTELTIFIDGADFVRAEALVQLVKLVYRYEPILEHTLAVSSERRDWLCRPMDAKFANAVATMECPTFDALREAWYGPRRMPPGPEDVTQFFGLNLHRFFGPRNEIAFRYCNATLDPGLFTDNLLLVVALAAKALREEHVPNERKAFCAASDTTDVIAMLADLRLVQPASA